MLVIGVAQRASAGPDLEVTPLTFIDPAPVYQTSSFASTPDSGSRLAAVQFRMTNLGHDDELIGPTGTVRFHGSDGKTYDDSFVDTSAGPMFDQLWLARDQSMVGYSTAEIPENVTVETVDFEVGFERSGDVLRWEVAGPSVVTDQNAIPAPPADDEPRAGVRPLGEQVEVTGERDGTENRLEVTATKIIDPAEAAGGVRPGEDRRLVGVEFAVRNTGDSQYNDIESDADLRMFALFNEADEAVRSHIYGVTEQHGLPLPPKTDDTWTVLFEVPTDYVVDRIVFRPMFGDTTITAWAARS